ncbi:phosphate ABC transporter ATP-binding protein [Hyperthermus butylicus]|uniref:Phosphate import ATP-binding protein n=1 Tax=Hyperthermus butylicus (strain DSM 5456 / JCM 9403 / PLM1-5) TaxID=415426 RepID=A2BKI3_HYPBU|nr:phosphate ABC transporter ATP-binding protein [Hyperthermus butylicus]ABM80494.1 phosphate import ATP-binding protein [Hyperthermus butylicus DSM 5456]
MTRQPAVSIRGLNVWIRGKHVLKNIDLDIPEAAVTVILGPSGSGKSTLLRTINRLIDFVPGAKVEGKVLVFGVDALKADPYELRSRIGMVFQTPNPFPHMSIYENVAVAAKINRVAKTREELDQIVKWALEAARLWDEVKDRLHDPPTALSGGQQQRLCLARALAMRPKLLLLDEPTANIDAHNTVMIENALRSLVEELGLTIILVTHMPHQALRVADYIAVIYNGQLVEYGPADEIAVNPKHEFTVKLFKGEVG